MSSNYVDDDDGGARLRSIPFRYVWPAELDLMARIAGLVSPNDGRTGPHALHPREHSPRVGVAKAGLDRTRRDRRGPAAERADVWTGRRRTIAAEAGSPCAVVEFDLAELYGCGQCIEKQAQRGRGE